MSESTFKWPIFREVYTTKAQDIFISEYFEGNGGQKAIEIVNNSGSAVDLSKLRLKTYYNGSANSASPVTVAVADDGLTKQIPNGGVFVFYFNGNAGFNSPDPNMPNAKPSQRAGISSGGSLGFSGNDAVELQYNNGSSWVMVDLFGKIGDDAGGKDWRSSSGPYISASNRSLYRLPSVKTGVKSNPENFDIIQEWGMNYSNQVPEAPFNSLGITGQTTK